MRVNHLTQNCRLRRLLACDNGGPTTHLLNTESFECFAFRPLQREGRAVGYVRVGRLDILPALGEVLLQLVERVQAQLPLQLGSVLLFGRQHLPQSADLLLHLATTRTQERRC